MDVSQLSSSTTVVAVTGASGFIGSHLVQHLVEHGGYHVRACVRNLARASHLKASCVEICVADMKNPGAYDAIFEGCSVVFHVAGNFGTDPTWRETIQRGGRRPPAEEILAKLQTTSHPNGDHGLVPSYDHAVYESYTRPLEYILESIQKSSTVQRLIYTSSGAAGGIIQDRDEDDFDLDGAILDNAYGRAKMDCERRIYQFGQELQKLGRPMICASSCPCIVLGPLLASPLHDTVYQHRLADMLAGRYVLDQEWDIADVRDIAKTQRLMAESPHLINGTRFWNGWEPVWPVSKVLTFAQESFRHDARIQKVAPHDAAGSSEDVNSSFTSSSDDDGCSDDDDDDDSSFGVSEWHTHGRTTWSNPVAILGLQQFHPRRTILDTVETLLKFNTIGRPFAGGVSEICHHYTVAELDGCDEEMNFLENELCSLIS